MGSIQSLPIWVFIFCKNRPKKNTAIIASTSKLRVKGAKGGLPAVAYRHSLNYNVLEEAQQDPAVFDILENPYSLNPTGEQSGNDLPDISKAVFDKDFKAWIGPFIMAAIILSEGQAE
ncbi:MAG: hypothetical protein R2788_20480 [Saprospiraceae bacterium]